MLYCFFAHHRSASSSTNDILRELSRHLGWRHATLHDAAAVPGGLENFCRRRRPHLLTLSNARREDLARLPDFRGMHLIRDPRDVLVSSYFSHRDSHPTAGWPALEAHRRELRSVDEERGLLLEMDCRAAQFADLAAWQYDDPRILEWKMETLLKDPLAHFRQLLDFWQVPLVPGRGAGAALRPRVNRALSGLERRSGRLLPRWRAARLPEPALSAALARHSYAAKTGGRPPGPETPAHHYRAGTGGNWRGHFTPRVAARFDERFGALTARLGYEPGRAS